MALRRIKVTEEKFYTRKGDDGSTRRLGGKQPLAKSAALIETVGELDESNAALGLLRSQLEEERELQAILLAAQQRLSQLMGHLSATPELRTRHVGLTGEDVEWLERQIAQLAAELPPRREFVMPGATRSEALSQLTRTIIRRAERRLVALAELEPSIGAANLAFINRLSSLLFVMALRLRDKERS